MGSLALSLALSLAIALALFATPAVAVGAAERPQLVVYTYDSFASEWGPAQALKQAFEARTGAELVFVAPSDSGTMLARLATELQTGGTDADVFIGLSDTELPRALRNNLFLQLDESRIPNLARVPQELRFDGTGHVVPFDHGYVTIVYNLKRMQELNLPLPQTLEDLTKPIYRRSLIALDPRTSSPGHAFLMWTIAEYGEEGYLDFWRRLSPNLLTITNGWSAAYEMFEAGEAPMVVSYATDTAYQVYATGEPATGVLTPGGAAYRQIEGAGIVRTTDQLDLAYALLDVLLSQEVQEAIPTTQWMFPVNSAAQLPDFFQQYAVIPERAVSLDPDRIDRNNSRWLREWATEITAR